MNAVELVTSFVSREGDETERTVRFVGELLATYTFEYLKESLYAWEVGGYLIYREYSRPLQPRYRSLSPDLRRQKGYTAEEVARWHSANLGTVLGFPLPYGEPVGTLTVHRRPIR
jgi:hypothetical protein